jgi:hypothetical protein
MRRSHVVVNHSDERSEYELVRWQSQASTRFGRVSRFVRTPDIRADHTGD